MSDDHPERVAVLIPARDEVTSIRACLEAVLAQDLGADSLEVVVATGGSRDGTAELVQDLLARSQVALGHNVSDTDGSTSANLNAGLREVTAPIVCRVDARSLIPPDYVRRCREILLSRPEVAVVGGRQVTQPRDESATATGIARALNNRWAAGLSRYRRGARSGAADTVYLGAFRTEQLRRLGGWRPELPTNQDFDLNRRAAALGVVWFEAGLEVQYFPRESLRALWRQYRRFGAWKVRYWRLTEEHPRGRPSRALLRRDLFLLYELQGELPNGQCPGAFRVAAP